jgi:hypothetical protein
MSFYTIALRLCLVPTPALPGTVRQDGVRAVQVCVPTNAGLLDQRSSN